MTVPEKKQMNAGVELLLKRMETHPEEFTQDHKWMGVIRSYEKYLGEEDFKALDDGINGLMQQKFTEIVLEGLVDPKPSTSLKELLSTKQQSATLSAGQTPVRSSVTLNNTNAVGTDLEYIQKQKQKENKTLFGKLKNYLHAE